VLSFPLLIRELRVQSRKRSTHDGRVGWGLASFLVLAFFVWHFPNETVNGRNVLSLIHFCLAIMLLIVAPLGAADSISREKREGTLGLLMLTHLTPFQVVLGKLASHLVRLSYFLIMALPFLMLPILMGGVEFRDLLFSSVILISIAVVGLASGLLASTLFVSFGVTLGWAFVFGVFFTWLDSTAVVNGFLDFFPTRRLNEVPAFYRIFMFGPGAIFFPVQAREVAVMFFIGPNFDLYIQIGLLLFSATALWSFVQVAVRKVARHADLVIETKSEAVFRKKFLTPILWRSHFRNSMARKLSGNPLIWLEYRTPWTRMARWLMAFLIVLLESLLLCSFPSREEFLATQFYLLLAVVAFLTLKSSSSFQSEKESGAFELLLVTPLTEKKLLSARLAAVASYYFLPVSMLIVFGLSGLFVTQLSSYVDQSQLSVAVNLLSLCLCIVSAPICGLYFSLRHRTFLPALLWTSGVAVLLPMCVWSALNGLLWMANSRGEPDAAVYVYRLLHDTWTPVLLAVVLYHFLIAAQCYSGTLALLGSRHFASAK